jgi:hypothetical protein
VHVARTGKYTLIDCHPKRGTAGIDALGVPTGFAGVVVHDAWAPYDTYTDTAPAGSWCWATQAADAIVALHRLTVDATTTGIAIDPKDLAAHTRLLRHAAHIGIT